MEGIWSTRIYKIFNYFSVKVYVRKSFIKQVYWYWINSDHVLLSFIMLFLYICSGVIMYNLYHIHRLLDSLLNFSSRATIICFKSEFSFFRTSTSLFNAPFSSSRYLALMAIWFSLSLLASRERLAASLFLYLLAQYLLFFNSSGTNCFFLFRMIGCGFSSSSENLLVAGSKS